MKYVWLAFGLAATTFACDIPQVGIQSKELARAAKHFERYVATVSGYQHLSNTGYRLEEDARRLSRLVQNGATCGELKHEFRKYVEPSFAELRRQHKESQQLSPNAPVKDKFREVSRNHRQLGDALHGSGGGGDACGGLSGNYNGVCRVDNSSAATPISFTVGVQGPSCIASNSAYFQPAALAVGGGHGTANVVGHPGGVAINQTTLTVQGQGRFVMRGYNYAGKFWFSCTP